MLHYRGHDRYGGSYYGCNDGCRTAGQRSVCETFFRSRNSHLPSGQDMSVVFKAERENLELTQHSWVGEKAEERLMAMRF